VITITVCFVIELTIAKPVIAGMFSGLIPRLTGQSLYVAIGILGATVMPHNLYLHSALVQTRRIGSSVAEKRTACRFNLIDSVVALNGAMIVNASILILAATVFFQRHIVVNEIQQAHLLLSPLLGTTLASMLFAVALLAAGQSSTLTGTLAGQIIMEGFLNLRMRAWLRRFITRSMAIVPAAIVIYTAGEKGSYQLLLLSQVIISMQLSFAVIPLVQFTSDRKRMGEFANARWVRWLAWLVTAIIVVLNISLASTAVSGWLQSAGQYRVLLWVTVLPVCLFILSLLLWITFEPILPRAIRELSRTRVRLPESVPVEFVTPVYRQILVPLDHSDQDRETLVHAAALAKAHGSKLHLLHVEEDVTSQVYGALSSTAEVELGRRYFEDLVERLKQQGIDAELVITPGQSPRNVIVEWSKQNQPDLIVMGAHGHRGLKDLIFGRTIDAVRHALDIPLLVVRSDRK
jgi:manganese transport protein